MSKKQECFINVSQLATIDDIAYQIARICKENKITVKQLMPFLTGVAIDKLSKLK